MTFLSNFVYFVFLFLLHKMLTTNSRTIIIMLSGEIFVLHALNTVHINNSGNLFNSKRIYYHRWAQWLMKIKGSIMRDITSIKPYVLPNTPTYIL